MDELYRLQASSPVLVTSTAYQTLMMMMMITLLDLFKPVSRIMAAIDSCES